MKLVLIIISISFLTSCYGWHYKEEVAKEYKDDYYEKSDIYREPDQEQDYYNEQPDEVNDEGCTLDTEWMNPEEGWKSWTYLKIIGEVAEKTSDYEAAIYVNGMIRHNDRSTPYMDGTFIRSGQNTIYADIMNYEFVDVDQAEQTAVVDYWEAALEFNNEIIPTLNSTEVNEVSYGAHLTFCHQFFDIKFDYTGAVKNQLLRKICFLGISKFRSESSDYPIGGMSGCFEDNYSGAPGEKLKMMFKNEMDESRDSLLEFFNKRDDGTVAVYGDEDFKHLCHCFDTDGKKVSCWEYDGPGGPEECPDYVPEEDCKEYNSCDPNPCLAITGSDGVCTSDGEDFFCGCKENYKWDNESNLCDPERRLVDCNNTIPENSSFSGTGKFYQTWDGDSWEPAVSTCGWECDEGLSESEGECLKTDDDIVPDDDTE